MIPPFSDTPAISKLAKKAGDDFDFELLFRTTKAGIFIRLDCIKHNSNQCVSIQRHLTNTEMDSNPDIVCYAIELMCDDINLELQKNDRQAP